MLRAWNLWWNVMLRRPVLSILSTVYSLVAEDDNEPQDLQSAMRMEILALVIISPQIFSMNQKTSSGHG